MDKKMIKNIENRGGKCPPPKKKFNFKCCKTKILEVIHFDSNCKLH